MTWLMIVYLLGLFYFAANPAKIVSRRRFRRAWIIFAIIPLISGISTFLRTFTVGYARSSAVLEIIGNSLSWAVFTASLLLLLGAILPADNTRSPQQEHE